MVARVEEVEGGRGQTAAALFLRRLLLDRRRLFRLGEVRLELVVNHVAVQPHRFSALQHQHVALIQHQHVA